MKQVIPMFEDVEMTHFNTTSLISKAEAACLYMMLNNYYSADVLFEDLITKPSNDSEYQTMLALFVLHVGSFKAKEMQSFQYLHLIIRSRKWWWAYPLLYVLDWNIKTRVEAMFCRSKYSTFIAIGRQTPYADIKLNQDLYRKMLNISVAK